MHARLPSLAAVALAVPCTAGAQTSPAPDYTAPRTAYGQPDLQGIWSNATITPLERPEALGDKAFFTEEEARRYEQRTAAETDRDVRAEDRVTDVLRAYNDFWWDSGERIVPTRRTSLIVDPPDGRIPALTEDGRRRIEAQRERRRRNAADGPEDRPLMERCLQFASAGPPMMPSFYNNNYHLVQTEDYVLIVNEMAHETRVVPLEGRAPPPGNVPQWRGTSHGRWEGDTLIVETTRFREETSFRGSGPGMRLTERFTRIANDVLLYEFTVDDPATFTRPWTVQVPSVRTDGLMYEYACHEGNRSLAGVLAGARAEERAAAEADTGDTEPPRE